MSAPLRIGTLVCLALWVGLLPLLGLTVGFRYLLWQEARTGGEIALFVLSWLPLLTSLSVSLGIGLPLVCSHLARRRWRQAWIDVAGAALASSPVLILCCCFILYVQNAPH